MGKKKRKSKGKAKKTAETTATDEAVTTETAEAEDQDDTNEQADSDTSDDREVDAPMAPPAEAPSSEADDEDWDIASGGARPHWLFKMSGFALIVFGVIIAFGGWYVSRQIPPIPNRVILETHNEIVVRSLLYGVLLILSGVLLKLYALVLVLNATEEEQGFQPLEGEWFLKMSTLIFSLTAGAVLIRGFLETHMTDYALSGERDVVSWYVSLYLKKCVISGVFFLLLAVFTLLYLISYKIVRGTSFEETY